MSVDESYLDLNRIGDARLVSDAAAFPPDEPRALRPRQRLRPPADDGSLQVIRSEVTSWAMGEKARIGDGVAGGSPIRISPGRVPSSRSRAPSRRSGSCTGADAGAPCLGARVAPPVPRTRHDPEHPL